MSFPERSGLAPPVWRDGSSSALWARIEGVGALTKAVLWINLGSVGICAIGDAMHQLGYGNLLWWGGIAAAWTTLIAVGVWKYRSSRRSLRAFLRMVQLCFWSLALTLVTASWSLSYVTGTQPYYVRHWMVIAALFVVSYILLTCFLALIWKRGIERFQALASFRASGVISASDFYSIWFGQGSSSGWTRTAPLLIGLAASISIVSAILIQAVTGTDPRELLSHVVLMAAGCYAMSFMTCALWLQRCYLGRDDLQIVD